MENDFSLKMGTTSGLLLSAIPNLFSEDFVRTVILAAVGATVSFLVSLLLKVLTRRNK